MTKQEWIEETKKAVEKAQKHGTYVRITTKCPDGVRFPEAIEIANREFGFDSAADSIKPNVFFPGLLDIDINYRELPEGKMKDYRTLRSEMDEYQKCLDADIRNFTIEQFYDGNEDEYLKDQEAMKSHVNKDDYDDEWEYIDAFLNEDDAPPTYKVFDVYARLKELGKELPMEGIRSNIPASGFLPNLTKEEILNYINCDPIDYPFEWVAQDRGDDVIEFWKRRKF